MLRKISCLVLLGWIGLIFPFTSARSAAQSAPFADRIAIRQIDGRAEFYNTATSARFVPRGTNYIDFYMTEADYYQDRALATNVYDPARVRAAFHTLAERGYNTVRVFFDMCDFGPHCLGRMGQMSLNPGYLDNLVDMMHIAGEENIYLLLVSHDLQKDAAYWGAADQGANSAIQGHRNIHYLSKAGVETMQQYWDDVMQGLADREAPFEVLLGWELQNEWSLHSTSPPISLDAGQVTTANGQTYDLSDPEEKRQMLIDANLYYMDVIINVIRRYDPDTLISMGFFAPRFPNATNTGEDHGEIWYVDTAPLMHQAPIDFFDFHAYPGSDLSLPQLAENFGMVGYEEKPIIMGEVGLFADQFPALDLAAVQVQAWIAESCVLGFDGWLYWEYYGQDVISAMWGMVENDNYLLDALAPVNQPDPCVPSDLPIRNLAYEHPVQASQSMPAEPPQNAVDGTDAQWGSGDGPPQWIEIDLESPQAVGEIRLVIAQYPPGETHHRVWGILENGVHVLLADLAGHTTDPQTLTVTLPGQVPDVRRIYVETLASPSWVSWREIEVYAGEETAPLCVVVASNQVNLRSEPSTAAERAGNLNANEGALVDGQRTGPDGFIWWHLINAAWVRSDVVESQPNCAAVPALD